MSKLAIRTQTADPGEHSGIIERAFMIFSSHVMIEIPFQGLCNTEEIKTFSPFPSLVHLTIEKGLT
jgi:hypothetical protein